MLDELERLLCAGLIGQHVPLQILERDRITDTIPMQHQGHVPANTTQRGVGIHRPEHLPAILERQVQPGVGCQF